MVRSGLIQALYTTHEIARLLQVDQSTVAKWIDKAVLTAFRTPGGHRRVRQSDLTAFLVAHKMPIPDGLRESFHRLLVIDDEREAIDGIRRVLKRSTPKVELLTAAGGIEGVLLLAEERPSAALIDLSMPELDGLEVCRLVRTRPVLKGVKLFTMTARPGPEIVARSLKAGAEACFGKPVNVPELVQRLGSAEQET